jgi:organic hydroperoxide reductase OsmC/OhrA
MNYKATIIWKRNGQTFTDNRYSRVHEWSFDGGMTVKASSSPQVVQEPYSDSNVVDPEEAFLASVSSCHMLWFLSIAAKSGFIVERYKDEVRAVMEKDKNQKPAITRVTLRPEILYAGEKTPGREEETEMHEEAHEKCFIANSIRSKIVIEPVS